MAKFQVNDADVRRALRLMAATAPKSNSAKVLFQTPLISRRLILHRRRQREKVVLHVDQSIGLLHEGRDLRLLEHHPCNQKTAQDKEREDSAAVW